uniref:uncharacterized protein si:dkey-12l12.1 n=1 Tax=Gasterosteus aculeatus aculeatus TaxID=481459 RepID=UPI001A998353|nr:uncharacterized protein si:dkey-12l12.1 [Gasterosteus aculeatus aculeatus]
MGFTIWLCVLCLQASLLSHALDCSAAAHGEPRVRGQTADGRDDDPKEQRALPLAEEPVLSRRKRQSERRGPAHLSLSSLPGAVSVKGFPNTLSQVDRSRRHLAPAASEKKKNKRKSRPGYLSLLSNDKTSNPLQVIRARRQVKAEPPKRNSGRSGAFSVLGDPSQNDRPKRSIRKTGAAK